MIDFEKRLKSLKERRQGSRERAIFESMESMEASRAILRGEDVREKEKYESLNESAGVKYAIGAMAPVDAKSTRVSKQEGDRVADSLTKSLEQQGESVTKRLQGSVALDIHIKGHSDVDMLIITTNPVQVELPKAFPNNYLPATDPRDLTQIIKDVRAKSEKILPNNFPSAEIDCSNNKSISISGGSLARKIDIVPAIWYDTIKYQHSGKDHDRGVKILNKADSTLLMNFPFSHINLVNEKDELYQGNLKCVIRLMKNMIADMPDYKSRIAKRLSSYDLAAIAYHMNGALQAPYYMRLSLIEKSRNHLLLLLTVPDYRSTLWVPDNTRKIFDTDNKVEALEILAKEMDDLAISIFKELNPLRQIYDSSILLNKAIF